MTVLERGSEFVAICRLSTAAASNALTFVGSCVLPAFMVREVERSSERGKDLDSCIHSTEKINN